MLLVFKLLSEVGQSAGGKTVRPGMAAAASGDMPGPGAYGPSLTESWLAVAQPSDVPLPAFGSSIARQAQHPLCLLHTPHLSATPRTVGLVGVTL